jgi:hypothetical protein
MFRNLRVGAGKVERRIGKPAKNEIDLEGGIH